MMLGFPRNLGLPVCMLATLALGCSSTPDEPGGDDDVAPGGSRSDGGSVRTDGGGSSSRETGSQCDDGLDNDRNGKADCEDANCKTAASCRSSSETRDASVPAFDGSEGCTSARGEGLAKKLPVDVVWVIDDSFSMLDDTIRVQENMATFARSLIEAGFDDYHIIVLNEPALVAGAPWDATALGLDPSRFFAVSVIAFNDCLTPTIASFPQWSADLRPNAALHFIMVTDDNSLMSWPDFQGQMDSLLEGKRYTVHAIVDPVEHCLGSTQPGIAYLDAAKATGGQQRSICEADWTPTFQAIEDSIQSSAQVPCQYEIPNPGGGQTYDRSMVNVQHVVGDVSTPFKRKDSAAACADEAGWYYDNPEQPTQVLLCPAACALTEQQGGAINIDFVCNGIIYL